MQDFQFLTVPLKGGSRTSVNLARVLHAVESEGHVAFLFDTGTTLITEQDYESFDLRFSTEIPTIPSGAARSEYDVLPRPVVVRMDATPKFHSINFADGAE